MKHANRLLAVCLLGMLAGRPCWGEDKLPEAVAQALAEHFDRVTIKRVKAKAKDGVKAFEFRFTDEANGEKEYKAVIGADGKILEEEPRRLLEARVPKTVRDACLAYYGVKQPEGSEHGEWVTSTQAVGVRNYVLKTVGKSEGTYEAECVLKDNAVTALTVNGKAIALEDLAKTQQASKPVVKDTPQVPAQEPEIDPDVVRKVRKLIKSTLAEDEKAREEGWKGLRDMGNLAVPGLLALYKQTENIPPDLVRSILIALGDSKDVRAGPALVEIAKDKNPVTRAAAARAIGASNYKQGVAVLEAIVDDPKATEEEVRFAATSALRFGSAKGVDGLKRLLTSKDPGTRARAVFDLGKHGGKAHLEAITPLLKDTDVGVRMDAVEALARVGGKETFAPLIEGTKDAEYKIRSAAMDALRAATGKSFGNQPQEWQEWWVKEQTSKKEPAEETKQKEEELKVIEAKQGEKIEEIRPPGLQPPLPQPNPDKKTEAKKEEKNEGRIP